jgi:hypothetical protein
LKTDHTAAVGLWGMLAMLTVGHLNELLAAANGLAALFYVLYRTVKFARQYRIVKVIPEPPMPPPRRHY